MTPRPDVSRLPSATSLRMAVVVAAVAVTGLFLGTTLFNAFLGDGWSRQIRECLGTDLLPTMETVVCQASAERERAAVSLGVAVGVVLLAAVVVAVVPTVVRRRLRLAPPRGRLAEVQAAVDALAAADGVRPPRVLVGRATLGSPFCLGVPGRYAVAMPPVLALRRASPLFVALVRHELAHLAHRDVTLSWLARCLGYVLVPLLLVPTVAFAVGGEVALALDLLWRAALLAAVLLLVERELLRGREPDADLRAARAPGVAETLDGCLAATPPPRYGWWSTHPTPTHRRAVLAAPALAVRMGVVDGLVLGFLAASTLPVLRNVLNAAVQGDPLAEYVSVVAALVVGVPFGATVAVGLWRESVVTRWVGGRSSAWRVALGAVVGGLVGAAATPAAVGLTGIGGLDDVRWLPVLPLALGAAVLLSAGLGAVWAGGRWAGRSPRGVWAPALVAGSVVAAALLWFAQGVTLLGEAGPPGGLADWLSEPGSLWPLVLAAVVAVGTCVAAVPGGRVPEWLFPDRAPARADGAATGARAAAGAVLAALAGAGVLLLPAAQASPGPTGGIAAPPSSSLVPTAEPTPEPVPVPDAVYRGEIARQMLENRIALGALVRDIQGTATSNGQAADRFEAELLPRFDAFLLQLRSLRPQGDEARAAHALAVDGTERHAVGYTLFVAALRADDGALGDRAAAEVEAGNARWTEWADAVAAL